MSLKGTQIAMQRACPKCGAAPGFPCKGKRGDRAVNHIERRSTSGRSAHKPVKLARAALGQAKPYKLIERTGFYWSDEWRAMRYAALKASNGICECCGARPSLGKPLHVDHIKPRSKFPELQLDPANLQVLCFDCNKGKSNTDQTDWRQHGGIAQ